MNRTEIKLMQMLPVGMNVPERLLVGMVSVKTRLWAVEMAMVRVMARIVAGEMLPVGMTYVGAVSRASVIARVLVGKRLKTRVWTVEIMTRVSAGEMLPVNRAFVMTRVWVGEAAAVRVMYKMWPDLYQVMR